MRVFVRLARHGCAIVLLASFCNAPASWAEGPLSFGPAAQEAAEQRLEAVLARRGAVEFYETPLHAVVETLRQDFQVPLILAGKRLEEAGISVDTAVTQQLRDVPLESILRIVLDELELTFLIRDDVIVITTPENAEHYLIARVYPVLDLVALPSESPRRPIKKGRTGEVMAASYEGDYDSLIELISTTIHPSTWDEVGGPGAIDPLPSAGAIVVSQTRDVHRAIADLLTSLRRCQAHQGLRALPYSAAVAGTASPSARTSWRIAPLVPPAAWQVPRLHAAEE